jgi:pilus assembly protein CpaB
MVTQNLLQDAIVLQMGDFEEEEEIQAEEQLVSQNPQLASDGVLPSEPAAPPPAQNEEPAPEPKLPEFMTLIVSPQDAITLNYLIFNGAQLTIALRAAGDDTRIQTEAVTLQFLLDQYNIPVPAKLPYGPEYMDPLKVTEPTPVP